MKTISKLYHMFLPNATTMNDWGKGKKHYLQSFFKYRLLSPPLIAGYSMNRNFGDALNMPLFKMLFNKTPISYGISPIKKQNFYLLEA
ncbi:MAG: hypothetical protein JKY48_11680 [Flavobacteriales bacterium]|nr:hypothetical protein [Flavobacteriales bacterium]